MTAPTANPATPDSRSVDTDTTLRLAIPKGRMHDSIGRLLADAGMPMRAGARDYRPSVPLEDSEVKVLKPRAVIEMLDSGVRDVGFAGADWVAEDGASLVELLDTGLDRVRLVAAAPRTLLGGGGLPDRRLIVASEYPRLTRRWIDGKGIDASLLLSFGATEVLPPEDADCIVDNTATGATLRANGLEIIDELMTSSTRLYASERAMDNPAKRGRIEAFALLIGSVLEARTRAMIELNVGSDDLARVVEILPCMREPTVSQLHAGGGWAVKAAVPRKELPTLIPRLKEAGGSDVIVTTPEQIVP
ncbi:MAG: ATP phosphoribosyltransferase [Planctomycetota bacterium]